MKIQNSEIAENFNLLADLLEIEGANPFRIRAYRNAARTLLGYPENMADLVHEGANLTELPGIGNDLASKIKEIVESGHLELLRQTQNKTPRELASLLKIPSLGPKRVGLLYKQYGIKTIKDLQKFAESKRILEVRGFGEKTRMGILEELKKIQSQTHQRLKLNDAQENVDLVMRHLERIPLQHLTAAGSFRRRQDTVGDIDILATSKNGANVIDHFLKLESIAKVVSHGKTRSTVVLRTGVQVDLRVVPDISYGAALLYFTGSKSHNIALREMASKRGLKINEYGIFKGTDRLASKCEEEIYRALGLPYIEPELRENRGEIEVAGKGRLPKLLNLEDIRGDLHVHTKESDGVDTIEDLAVAAKNRGYSYIAITDHSKRMTVAHGLDLKRVSKQISEIDRVNQKIKGIAVLKSIEVDILEDGRLDLPDEVLGKLDFTVCAIHSHFHLSKEKQTRRILQAMENPNFTILAHPSGRMIGSREPLDIDLEKIILSAKKLNKILEINAQPERMDLSDIYCRMSKDAGVKMVISTDAHSISQLEYMKFGVGQARRGWLEKNDIINTLSLVELRNLFSHKPSIFNQKPKESSLCLS